MIDIKKSFEIMEEYGMTKAKPTLDTHEVEISYAGYTGRMPAYKANAMMDRIWNINPIAVFLVDNVMVSSPTSPLLTPV